MDLFKYFNHVTVLFAIIGFMAGFVYDRQKNRPSTLEDLWNKAAAAATVPTGFTLLFAAFDPPILLRVPDIHFQVAAVGLGTLFMAYKAFEEIFK